MRLHAPWRDNTAIAHLQPAALSTYPQHPAALSFVHLDGTAHPNKIWMLIAPDQSDNNYLPISEDFGPAARSLDLAMADLIQARYGIGARNCASNPY